MVLLASANEAHAAIFFEEKQEGQGSGASVTTSAALTNVNGNLYLASITVNNSGATISSVTGMGLTWTLLRRQNEGQGKVAVAVYWAQGNGGASGTVTANVSGSVNTALAVIRYSGVNTATPLGTPVSSTVSGDVNASMNLTTTSANSWAFFAIGVRITYESTGSVTNWLGHTQRAVVDQGGSCTDNSGSTVIVGDRLRATAGTYTTGAQFTDDGLCAGPPKWGLIAVEIKECTSCPPNLTQIHYRWRRDNSIESGLDSGTGADGAISLAAAFNMNTQPRAAARTFPDGVAYRVKGIAGTSITLGNSGGTTLANTNGIAAGDEILIINLQGASGDTGSVGNYEFRDVVAVSGGVVTVNPAPALDYDGSGNSFTTQKVFVQRVPNYTSVTTNAFSITAGAWDGGANHADSGCTDNTYTGIVAFRATGTVTVSAGGFVNVNGLGYRGGTGGGGTAGGTNGESYDGSVGSGGNDTTSGSGGGAFGINGGGASSNAGPAGAGPYTVSPAGPRGGGGGGGNADASVATDGAGGGGGGAYGGGGGGAGGGGASALGGTGGAGGGTNVAGGGGGAAGTAGGGNGGAAGSAGAGSPTIAAVGSGATTGQGGNGNTTTTSNLGAGGGGGGGFYGTAALTTMFLGSGGGGGGDHDNTALSGQLGGAAGGIIFVAANTFSNAGTVQSNGVNGTTTAIRSGAGGGGSGGSILIQAVSFTAGATFTANGGSGGTRSNPGGGGGAGGVGRIRIEANSITGTTNPTYSGAGTPAGPTFIGAEDTPLAGLQRSMTVRLRLEISNEGTSASNPTTYRLQYATVIPGGPWTTVPATATSEAWQMSASSYITNGEATSDISGCLPSSDCLTNENTTFVAGQAMDTGGTTSAITLSTSHFTEIEYAIEATSSASNVTYYFRVDNGVSAIDTYTQYAQVSGLFTAVKLAGFTARGFDSGTLVEWETTMELDNLGFHLYRGSSADGPWTRLNSSMIAGLGSSPEGRRYSWIDRGLTNGRTYYYRLDDVDRSGLVTSHGPVSAGPVAGVALSEDVSGSDPDEAPRPSPGGQWKQHGDPSDVTLRVLHRTPRGLTLELRTGGFYSLALPDGTVKLHVPGFFDTAEPGLPSVPVKRTWVDAVAGRGARIVSVQAGELGYFPRLLPEPAGAPEARAKRDGTYRASFRRVRSQDPVGLFPASPAQILETAFQEEIKKAYLELAPLRLDGARGRLVLARRLVVTIAFDRRVEGESGAGGSRGRRQPLLRGRLAAKPGEDNQPSQKADVLLARLAARASGLQAISWESLAVSPAVAQRGAQALMTSSLRLSRLGQPVAFHVEPRADRFAPGSTLYFLAQGPETAYANETVYELAAASGGVQMPVERPARAADTTLVPALVTTRSFEQNTNYLPGLLNARDLWLWDIGLLAPNGRDYSFSLSAPTATAGPAVLSVDLQGGSEAATVDPDHAVRVLVNGLPLGEASWDGLNPFRFEASLDASILVDGANTLRLEDLDTTGRFDSVVYLDRFTVRYPRQLTAEAGRLEGRALSSGLVRAAGFASGAVLLDVSQATPSWQTAAPAGGEITFPAEAGKSYLAVSPEAVLRPDVRPAATATLRTPSHQADWIVIAPQELLPAAEPLVAQRESQGLKAMAVSLQQVQDEFGYGERSPQMIRDFLAYAYHHWTQPSVRYVLLLGDASYDPKGFMPTATRKDLLPTPMVRSTFLWTASDPSLAAVNGDDAIPDLAIGRLSAGSLAEAEAAIQKVLAFEESGQRLDGNAVLVADNPDQAGNFEANANDIATLLPGRQMDRIFLTQLGSQTRARVLGAFDAGASLVSYVGHGSQVLWASEQILRSIDVALLQPQPRQPLLLTMTCSNGYFISPFLNGISERFVLEGGKGAIAAFSPSGLSLDEAAHLYHRALVQELQSGRHERLGDLVLASQRDYADTGAFPELLSIYHLFGDPALRIR